MNEAGKFEVYKKKLQGICDENNLIYTFRANEYPIKLTVRPTGENNDQMSLLEKPELDNEGMGEDAELIFTYKDGALFFRISDTFAVSEALFSKLKNLFRNMHSVWLQFFFRKIVEKKLLSTLPEIEDSIERDAEDAEDSGDDFSPADDADDDEGEGGGYDYQDPEDQDGE